jgi:pseudaminic acid synthase
VRSISIDGRPVGPGHPVYVIAEVSANHNGSLALARETVAAAAEAGADAIKLQTYRPDTITFKSDAAPFQIADGTLWDGRTLWDIYEEGQTPWEWHAELFEYANSLGLHGFSSPFDPTAVEFLSDLGVPAFKVASFEIVDLPLVRLMAERGLPVILSTGIAREDDVAAALAVCREVGNEDLVVLKCTSSYPAPFSELNLRTIPDIAERFDVVPGLSDHTMSVTAAVASVALGACVIERHLIVDRALGGLDSQFSTNAVEFADMVARVREAQEGLGEVTYELTPRAAASRRHSRSLFVVADVRPGDAVTSDNVRSIRPADGMPPARLPEILGSTFAVAVAAGTPLADDLLA